MCDVINSRNLSENVVIKFGAFYYFVVQISFYIIMYREKLPI